MRTFIAVAAIAVGLSGVAAPVAIASAAQHPAPTHRHHRQLGVCVSYAQIGGIDQDIQVVSSIYTPKATGRRCAKGDKFVAAGPMRSHSAHGS